MVKRLIGIGMICIGFTFMIYHYKEWEMGRSSAQELTEEDLQIYQQEKIQPESELKIEENTAPTPHKNSINSQIPSTEVQTSSGEKIGFLVIPKINQKYSLYWGADKQVLKKGVGLYVSELTTDPYGGGHTVLSGHRDTVFYRLGELKIGDQLKVEYGKHMFTYQVNKIWITDAQDQTVIVKKSEPTLTLTTCYPFSYIGNAPKRYIVQAVFINKSEKIDKRNSHETTS